MGKGDKKTRRGKIIMGTYGRLRRKKKDKVTTTKASKPKAAKKAAPKKAEE
ncbi:30S ribosomal protein THX [Aquimarina sp. D1M17]|uniref:30S ribosomal protein THX n=1 Tax=Aquimarina acroporae TaxID=2937283 RepID=UPI0020BEE5C3|nr:30S ribosomal protein THX [Aquimarina acroporae]MCK8521899.1 30S ribosomal protein THX [Aquimarina acroporae]